MIISRIFLTQKNFKFLFFFLHTLNQSSFVKITITIIYVGGTKRPNKKMILDSIKKIRRKFTLARLFSSLLQKKPGSLGKPSSCRTWGGTIHKNEWPFPEAYLRHTSLFWPKGEKKKRWRLSKAIIKNNRVKPQYWGVADKKKKKNHAKKSSNFSKLL